MNEKTRFGYYVDKTKFAKKLIESESSYFIIRPREFGKSYFIRTLTEICDGEKRFFNNCYISKDENNYVWKKYPIIDLDFSRMSTETPDNLKNSIKNCLENKAKKYELELKGDDVKNILTNLIINLSNLKNTRLKSCKYEDKIVVLIDEYDAALVNFDKESENYKKKLLIMKEFFSCLESFKKYFQLCLISGLTNFSLTAMFPNVKPFKDITVNKEFNSMFGFTRNEIEIVFKDKLEEISKNKSRDISEIINEMKVYCNGYKFHEDGESVYNNLSTLRYFLEGTIGYCTGIPTVLANYIDSNTDYFKKGIDNLETKCSKDTMLFGDKNGNILTALLFQTGFLTIRGFDKSSKKFTLEFANNLLYSTLKTFVNVRLRKMVEVPSYIQNNRILSALYNKNITEFIKIINNYFEHLNSIEFTEKNMFHSNLIFILNTNSYFIEKDKFYVDNCVQTLNGRIDILIEFEKIIYIIELNFNGSAKNALEIIQNNGYSKPYLCDKYLGYTIILLGINFNKIYKHINDFKMEVIKVTNENICKEWLF